MKKPDMEGWSLRTEWRTQRTTRVHDKIKLRDVRRGTVSTCVRERLWNARKGQAKRDRRHLFGRRCPTQQKTRTCVSIRQAQQITRLALNNKHKETFWIQTNRCAGRVETCVTLKIGRGVSLAHVLNDLWTWCWRTELELEIKDNGRSWTHNETSRHCDNRLQRGSERQGMLTHS